MGHPRDQFRAYLEDGPLAGVTVSLEPAPDGSPPRRVTLPIGPGDRSPAERAAHAHAASDRAVYERSHPDLVYGLWVYRHVPSS